MAGDNIFYWYDLLISYHGWLVIVYYSTNLLLIGLMVAGDIFYFSLEMIIPGPATNQLHLNTGEITP